MPQDNQTPDIQGSDVLLDTLRRSRLTDDQRQQIWDAYHVKGDENSFVDSMRKLPVNDDVRQNLYDMRYKGWKNEPANAQGPKANQAQTVASLDTQTPAKGDVRPSNQDIQNQRIAQTNREISSFYGRMIPDAAVPYLAIAKKYLVDPFEKMSQTGAQVVGTSARIAAMHAGITGPKGQGVAEGAGELVGGVVADPRMWPFALEGAAKGALTELAARGFSSQMLLSAVNTVPEIRDAVRRGDSYEAARLMTIGTGSAALGALGAKEEPKTGAQQATDKAANDLVKLTPLEGRRVGSDRALNNRVKQATPMGPISETGGQQLQLDFTQKAPTEAHAPQKTDLNASKVANAPIVDRQALIAPKPVDLTGAEPPVPLTRFPKSVREGLATGGTQGMGPVDLTKPATGTQVGGFKIETDNLGVKWAVDPNGVRVSIPKSVADADVQTYAQGKMAEQVKIRADIKARVPEQPVQRNIPDLIQQLHGNFDRIADLNRQRDAAETDTLASELGQKHQDLEASVKSVLAGDMGKWQSKDLTTFRDSALTEAQKLEAQGKAIKDLTEATIKNRGIKNEIADLRSQGGPPRQAVVDPDTGERALVKPLDRAGRGGRSVLDELQGRVPTSDFSQIQIAAKPEGVSDQEWAEHVGKLNEERNVLKRKISDAVSIASETGASVADMGIDEHVDRLKQIESLMGKYADVSGPGRRPNIEAQVDEQGAIKAPEALKSWTLERARLALGAKVKQIPTDEEFFQHADLRNEKGRLFRGIADVADRVLKDKKREGQGGFLGEERRQPGVRGKVRTVSLADRVPSDEEMMRRANAAKIYGRELSDDFRMGVAGFLSKDGKIGIDTGAMSHDDVAETLIPETRKDGSALRAMLEKGWIRKASPIDYETWSLDPRSLKTIELDLLRNGKYGQQMYIDTRLPDGRSRPMYLEQGWDERHGSLEDAINVAKRRMGYAGEKGALPGVRMATGSAIGGIAGSLVGAHLGHPYEGAAIGWGLGFVTPAIAEHPLMWKRLQGVTSGVAKLGITAAEWLKGPVQDKSVLRDMDTIRDAQQRDLRGPVRSFVNRVSQLPGNFYRIFDNFAFINDRPGAIQNFLMKFDPRGQVFRDLRGKLDIENSPYVSAWIAAGGGGGMVEAHLLDYRNIIKDAQSNRLGEHLNDYLNLRGYQRVYDVMQERIQEADDAINKAQQALQTPKLPVEVEAGIRKALREAKAEKQEVIDRLTSKTLVPQPYDPPKIAADLQDMQAKLGPQFAQVQALANRVFGLNRKVLDMVHDSGIIGDAEYQKYTSRGDEYIPMHRILEDVSANTGRIADNSTPQGRKGSPLYLRQQNVIKALMGSDHINRDPIIASADANREAIREVIRNGVIKDYLKVAAADPQGVGSLFKQVQSGYKAKPEEGLVGFYADGQQHTFATPSWLSESLRNVSPSSLDVIGKGPLQFFSQTLRKGATVANLSWSIPNAIRHFMDMAIMSDAGLKDIRTLPKDAAGLIREWTKAVYSSVTHDQGYQEYLRSGAAYSTLQRMISPEMALDLKTLGFGQKIAHGRLVEVVQDFNAAVEDATKMTTYQRLRQAGYTEKAAAWETRRYGGGPDFAKQGNLTPAVNLVSMFFNAHLQYVSRVFARAAENPVRVGVALAAITGMAMTLNEHNIQQKDEKGNLLIRKVPYTDRENNFVVLTGDTYKSSSGATLPVYYKVPKQSFVKFLYNPIENMLNKVAGPEERTGTQLGLQAIGNLSPGQMDLQQGEIGKSALRGAVSSLNPIIRMPLEEAMNYKTTGTGGPIVPGREQNIDARFQYGPGTSTMAQRMGEGGVRGAIAGGAEGASIGYLLGDVKGAALGGALGSAIGTFGISPRRAEHIIDTTTAGVGRMATGFVDPFLAAVKQTHMEGPEKLANTPVAGPILGRFVSTSIDQQEQALQYQFYRDAQAAQQPMQTIEFLKKNHPEQIPAYIESHKDDLWKAQVATQMQNRLGQILNAQKAIEQNPQMSDKDRTDALKNLHAVKMQVLNVFTKVLRPSPQVGQAAAFPGQGQGAAR